MEYDEIVIGKYKEPVRISEIIASIWMAINKTSL